MTLFFPYFIPKNVERYNEILLCLSQNIRNDHITKVVLACDVEPCERAQSIINDKCIVWDVGRRITYSDVFTYANVNIDDDELCVLANSDIFFDGTLEHLHQMSHNMFACLTRYDVKLDGTVEYMNTMFMMRSQDTWAFKTPVTPDLIESSNFRMGINGCDNKIAMIAHNAGYVIVNPSLLVKTYHLHNIPERTYNKTEGLVSPYLYVWPTETIEPAYTEGYVVKWERTLTY